MSLHIIILPPCVMTETHKTLTTIKTTYLLLTDRVSSSVPVMLPFEQTSVSMPDNRSHLLHCNNVPKAKSVKVKVSSIILLLKLHMCLLMKNFSINRSGAELNWPGGRTEM